MSVTSNHCVFWALVALSVEGQEFVSFAGNWHATLSVWSWLHSWWADFTLSINSQEFVSFANDLDAVESSALHVVWALLAQSIWHQLLS